MSRHAVRILQQNRSLRCSMRPDRCSPDRVLSLPSPDPSKNSSADCFTNGGCSIKSQRQRAVATRGSKACATIPPASRMPQSIAATILFTKIIPFRVFSADCFCFYPIDAERGVLSYSFLQKYLISSFRPNTRSLPCAECPPDQAAHQG